MSSFVAIHNCHLETGHVQKFIINYFQLIIAGKAITLIWLPGPGHTGIQGNERADEAAKAALSSTVSAMKCPASDLNLELFTKYCREVWMTEWDGCSFNKLKLHSTLPNLISIIVVSHISVAVMLPFLEDFILVVILTDIY